jgi:hypothetical protein
VGNGDGRVLLRSAYLSSNRSTVPSLPQYRRGGSVTTAKRIATTWSRGIELVLKRPMAFHSAGRT